MAINKNTLNKINKYLEKSGVDGRITKGAEDIAVKFLTTGIPEVDYILSGGIASGRVSHLYGQKSGGKSWICQKMIAEAQKQGKTAAFLDCEGCLPADTIFFDFKANAIKTIQEIVDNKIPSEVLSYNVSKKSVEIKNVVDYFDNGKKQLYSITLTNGQPFRCTGNHKLFINGKFVEASQIKSGDVLGFSKKSTNLLKKNTIYKEEVKKELIYLIGFLLGRDSLNEGFLSQVSDITLIRKIKTILGKNKIDLDYIGECVFGSTKKSNLYNLLQDANLNCKTNTDKKIPKKLFTSFNVSVYGELLSGLMDANNSCGVFDKIKKLILFSHSSLSLILQIKFMLSTLGIDSYYLYKKTKNIYILYINYNKDIGSLYNILKLRSSEKANRLKQAIKGLDTSEDIFLNKKQIAKISALFKKNNIFVQINKTLSIIELKKLMNSFQFLRDDFGWLDTETLSFVTIKSIKKDKIEKTYDITVKDNHNFFLSNGALLHNSFMSDWAKKLGVNTEELIYVPVSDAEVTLQVMRELVESRGVDIIVLDSIAALTPRDELEKSFDEEAKVAGTARLMSKALRVLNAKGTGKVTMVFINQIRDSLDKYTGSTTPGGKAVGFFSTQEISVSRGKSIIEGTGDNAKTIGYEMRIVCDKNKVGIPRRKCVLRVFNDGTVDIEDMVVNMGAQNDIWGQFTKNGNSYFLGEEKIASKRDDFVAYLKENKEEFKKYSDTIVSSLLERDKNSIEITDVEQIEEVTEEELIKRLKEENNEETVK